MDLRGRHLISAQDWTREEIEAMLRYAASLKAKMKRGIPHKYLDAKTLLMICFEHAGGTTSVFETAMTQLGGHASRLSSSSIPVADPEILGDTSRVLSRYGHGIGVSNCEWKAGSMLTNMLARSAKVPVINLQSDIYHPSQAMGDLMTIKERFGNVLSGLKFVCSWAYGRDRLRPMSVPQSLVLLMTRFGMKVTLAHPAEFGLMPETLKQAGANARESGGSFEILEDMDLAFKGAHVVYPMCWGCFLTSEEVAKAKATADKYKDWICNSRRLERTSQDAIYMHCLPADRGHEVTDEVIDGPRSAVFDEAENRLHVAKAIMALTM